MKLINRHIAVTGANGGIGRAFCHMCAREKAHLHLILRSPQKEFVQELTSHGAASVTVYYADLSSPQQVRDLAEKLKSINLDILFNNAGLLTGGLLEEQSLEDIQKMLQVNLNALIELTHSLLPGMLKKGHGKIINNSSVSGVMTFPCASTYAASKAAVLSFTKCLELELKGTGVSTLVLITPGIKTRMFDQIQPMYGKNLEFPANDYISPEKYAQRIKHAIENDETVLQPPFFSMTGLGLRISRHFSGLFNKAVLTRFKRS
jgi:short-subunit dehydrogenase